MDDVERCSRVIALTRGENEPWEFFAPGVRHALAQMQRAMPDWFRPTITVTRDPNTLCDIHMLDASVGGIDIGLGFVAPVGHPRDIDEAQRGLRLAVWHALEGLVSGRITPEEFAALRASPVGLSTGNPEQSHG